MKKILLTFGVALFLNQLLFGQENVSVTRPATIAEMQQLFDLATTKPQRFRIVADITVNEPAWTKEQIASELEHQNTAMESRDNQAASKHFTDLTTIRSNAIAEAHSGIRVKHVQEWYSTNKFRLDQNQESALNAAFLKTHPGSYHDTFVDIGDDPAFSPYRSFLINRELHDVQLSKSPASQFARDNLWRVLGLDEQIANPLIIALMDFRSVPPYHKGDPSTVSLAGIKIDSLKSQAIHNGSDPNWHLEADEESLDGNVVTRFRLKGKIFDPGGSPETISGVSMTRSSIEAAYWIIRESDKMICLQATLTNLTTQESFSSKRAALDSNGYPRRWEISIARSGVVKTTEVLIKEIDPNPSFSDDQIFSPRFATNDIVSDITYGDAVVSQQPHPEAKVNLPPATIKRFYILLILALLSVAPVLIIAFRWKRHRRFK